MTSAARRQSASRSGVVVPVTGCIRAGWRSSHAMAIVVLLTPYFAASSSSFAFSAGNFACPMNTPSKNPNWKGDHG